MRRNYERHPEMFSSTAVAADYDPDADGGKADAPAELRATQQPVTEYCHPQSHWANPATASKPTGPANLLLANPRCPACVGTGRPTHKTLVAGLDALNSLIDELASTAGDICTPAKRFLDLAWWHTENAIRQLTGKCSMACKRGRFCACCHHYHELKPLAERMRRPH